MRYLRAVSLTGLCESSFFRPTGLSGLVTTPTMLYPFSISASSKVAESSGVPMKTVRTFGISEMTGETPTFSGSIFFAEKREKIPLGQSVICSVGQCLFSFLFSEAVDDEDAV